MIRVLVLLNGHILMKVLITNLLIKLLLLKSNALKVIKILIDYSILFTSIILDYLDMAVPLTHTFIAHKFL